MTRHPHVQPDTPDPQACPGAAPEPAAPAIKPLAKGWLGRVFRLWTAKIRSRRQRPPRPSARIIYSAAIGLVAGGLWLSALGGQLPEGITAVISGWLQDTPTVDPATVQRTFAPFDSD